jgi:hypothetical protein
MDSATLLFCIKTHRRALGHVDPGREESSAAEVEGRRSQGSSPAGNSESGQHCGFCVEVRQLKSRKSGGVRRRDKGIAPLRSARRAEMRATEGQLRLQTKIGSLSVAEEVSSQAHEKGQAQSQLRSGMVRLR